MKPRALKGWMVAVLLLGVAVYAIAEEITLTTYYPSPRAAYQELRTASDVAIGTLEQPAARLHVVQEGGLTAMRVDDEAPQDGAADLSPFVIVSDRIGIGTANPDARVSVDVAGGARLGDVTAEFPGDGMLRWNGSRLQGYANDQWRDFLNMQPGVQMAYVTAPPNTNNPPCPAGSGAPIIRKWVSRTCTGIYDNVASGGGWAVEAPSTSYQVAALPDEAPCWFGLMCPAYADDGSDTQAGGDTPQGPTGPTYSDCQALDWTEAICLGN